MQSNELGVICVVLFFGFLWCCFLASAVGSIRDRITYLAAASRDRETDANAFNAELVTRLELLEGRLQNLADHTQYQPRQLRGRRLLRDDTEGADAAAETQHIGFTEFKQLLWSRMQRNVNHEGTMDDYIHYASVHRFPTSGEQQAAFRVGTQYILSALHDVALQLYRRDGGDKLATSLRVLDRGDPNGG